VVDERGVVAIQWIRGLKAQDRERIGGHEPHRRVFAEYAVGKAAASDQDSVDVNVDVGLKVLLIGGSTAETRRGSETDRIDLSGHQPCDLLFDVASPL